MAHPPLNKEKHPACVQVRTSLFVVVLSDQRCSQAIDDLLQCRENNPYLKFLGACNNESWALLRCFKEEKEPLRCVECVHCYAYITPCHSKAHRDAARADQQRLKETFDESRAHVQEVLAKQHARRQAEEDE